MPRIAAISLALAVAMGITACGGGGGDEASAAPQAVATDNSTKKWSVEHTYGYSGGDVEFGGQKIIGEWSTEKTLTVSGTSDAFKSTSNYMVLSVRFEDPVAYSEYWSGFKVVGGKVVSDSAWTSVASYGVSRAGDTLTLETGVSMKRFTLKKSANACLEVREEGTGDEYQLCKKT